MFIKTKFGGCCLYSFFYTKYDCSKYRILWSFNEIEYHLSAKYCYINSVIQDREVWSTLQDSCEKNWYHEVFGSSDGSSLLTSILLKKVKFLMCAGREPKH